MSKNNLKGKTTDVEILRMDENYVYGQSHPENGFHLFLGYLHQLFGAKTYQNFLNYISSWFYSATL